jgi:hypothetical protein
MSENDRVCKYVKKQGKDFKCFVEEGMICFRPENHNICVCKKQIEHELKQYALSIMKECYDNELTEEGVCESVKCKIIELGETK